jgi:transposase
MIERMHGIDRHKEYSAINVLNLKGEEITNIRRCYDLASYVEKLTPEDAVVLEASNGSFHWADKIEERGLSKIRGKRRIRKTPAIWRGGYGHT